MVPATNGSIPKAPAGGHSSHAGTLLDGAELVVPDDPPEFARPDAVDVAPVGALDRTPPVPVPVAVVADIEPVAGAVVVVTGEVAGFPEVALVAVEVAGFPEVVIVAVEPPGLVPRLTTPLRVTLPGVAATCAAAGNAAAIEKTTA